MTDAKFPHRVADCGSAHALAKEMSLMEKDTPYHALIEDGQWTKYYVDTSSMVRPHLGEQLLATYINGQEETHPRKRDNL